jgi:hypothetical protein
VVKRYAVAEVTYYVGVEQDGVYSTCEPTKNRGRSIGMNMPQDAILQMKDHRAVRAFVGPLFFFRAGDSLDFLWLTQQRDDFIRTHPDSNLPLSQGRLRFNSCMLRPFRS